MYRACGYRLALVLLMLLMGVGMPVHALTMDGPCPASCPARLAACGPSAALSGDENDPDAAQGCTSSCAMAAVILAPPMAIPRDAPALVGPTRSDGSAFLRTFDPAPPRPGHRA